MIFFFIRFISFKYIYYILIYYYTISFLYKTSCFTSKIYPIINYIIYYNNNKISNNHKISNNINDDFILL